MMLKGDVAYHAFLLDDAEGAHLGFDAILAELCADDGIVVPVDEGIFLCLVLHDSHFGIGILLHRTFVAVQMVGRYVEQNGNVRTEVVHVVELETAEFDDVVLEGAALGNLECEAPADVSSQPDVVAGLLEDVVNEARGGRFAVGACDADHLGIGVAAGELNLADDGNAGVPHFLHHRRVFGNAWALDDFASRQNEVFAVLAFFKRHVVLAEHLFVVLLYLAHIADEDVEAFHFRQRRCSYTALGGS